jgi:hypothetical protein
VSLVLISDGMMSRKSISVRGQLREAGRAADVANGVEGWVVEMVFLVLRDAGCVMVTLCFRC